MGISTISLKIEDRTGFRNMFGMMESDFKKIFQHIGKEISPEVKPYGTRPILVEERLALTLRYLATGETFRSLELQFCISLRAISYIVTGACDAITKIMVPIYIKPPKSVKEWLEIAKNFEDRWNFPHALEAIDGKHIIIQKPIDGGSFYYNYKHTHSVILLTITGPDYECLYPDVGKNGRVNDGGVWNSSGMFKAIENGSAQFPKDDKIHETSFKLPYVLLGDDAFALKRYMMKPYQQQNLTSDKRIYNYRHSRARQISENLFGILASRWNIYSTKILLHPDKMNSLVLTTLALHSMLRRSSHSRNLYTPCSFTDTLGYDGNIIKGEWRRQEANQTVLFPLQPRSTGHNSSISAKQTRDSFKDYFVSERAVDWQSKKC